MHKALAVPTRVAALLGLLWCGPAFFCAAFAADAGHVSFVKGSAWRTAASGIRTELRGGGRIASGDRLATGSRSYLSVNFTDGTRFSLGPNTVFAVEQVDASGAGLFSAAIVKGAFRFVTGLIAKRRPAAMRVRVGSVATIGIRGTAVGGEVVGEAAIVVLLDGEQADVPSAIEVGNEYGSVLIDQTGYGTRVPDALSPPSPPRRMALRTVDNLVRNLNSIQRNAMPRPQPRIR